MYLLLRDWLPQCGPPPPQTELQLLAKAGEEGFEALPSPPPPHPHPPPPSARHVNVLTKAGPGKCWKRVWACGYLTARYIFVCALVATMAPILEDGEDASPVVRWWTGLCPAARDGATGGWWWADGVRWFDVAAGNLWSYSKKW